MDTNERAEERNPSSAMLRDATRLRAVMGGQVAPRPAADLPMPDGVEQSSPSSPTRMRIDSVPDTPPSTVALVTAVPISSATRIIPPSVTPPQPAVTIGDTGDVPRSEPTPDETPTRSLEPATQAASDASYDRAQIATGSYVPVHRSHRSRGRFAFIAITLGLVIGVGVWTGIGGEIAALFTSSSADIPLDDPAHVTETPTSLRNAGGMATTPPLDPAGTGPIVIESPSASEWEARESMTTPATPAGAADLTSPHTTRSSEIITDRASDDRSKTATRAMPLEEKRGRSPIPVVESEPHVSNQVAAQDRQVKGDETRGSLAVHPVADGAPREGAPERTTAGSARRYSVQVRATSDRREAEGIASRLREKGVASVRVEKSKRNGVDMFRVRYGEFSSDDEAQKAAERLRHQNVWIVRQP